MWGQKQTDIRRANRSGPHSVIYGASTKINDGIQIRDHISYGGDRSAWIGRDLGCQFQYSGLTDPGRNRRESNRWRIGKKNENIDCV